MAILRNLWTHSGCRSYAGSQEINGCLINREAKKVGFCVFVSELANSSNVLWASLVSQQ